VRPEGSFVVLALGLSLPLERLKRYLRRLMMLPAKAWNLFRAGARVTFFGAKKVTKETLKSNSNLPPELWSGFFDETSLSHRKTMHILCIALRVSS
jgi:hypothetical protein